MLRFLVVAFSSLSLALLGACDASMGPAKPDVDAGADAGAADAGTDSTLVGDAALQPQTQITLTGANPLAVPAGEDVLVEFLVTRNGLAVPYVVVGFAIDGTAADTSLDRTSWFSDADGHAEVTIRGGTIPTTFQLRATAPDAPAVYVTVNVAGGTASSGASP